MYFFAVPKGTAHPLRTKELKDMRWIDVAWSQQLRVTISHHQTSKHQCMCLGSVPNRSNQASSSFSETFIL